MNKNQSLLISIILSYSFILAIISGLQIFGKNPDYVGYELIFGDVFERPNIEPIFSVFRYINDFLFNSSLIPVFFLFTFFSLQVKSIVMYKMSQNDICFIFSLFYYFITFFLIHEYTQIRAASAIAVYFLALMDLINNKIYKYYIKACIAMLFHYSAIVMFIFPIFSKIFSTRKRLFILIFIGLLFAFLGNVFLGENLHFYIYMLENYLGFSKSGNVSDFIRPWNLKYAVLTFVCIILLFSIDFDKKNFVLMQSCIFGLCFFYYLNPIHLPVVSVRFAEFNTSFVVILFVNSMWNFFIKEKIPLLIFIGIFFALYFKATINTLGL